MTNLMLVLALSLSSVLVVPVVPVVSNDDRLKDAEEVLTEMAGTDDAGIPKSLIQKAECVVVVPGLKKVALGIGGQYGKGYVSCRRDGSWSAPGALKVEGGSFGLQIGASSTDVILLVMNQKGIDRLLSNQFKVGADAAVAAGPIGREASAQTDISMRAEMLAWSRSRGAYAGIALQGSTIRQDSDENKELYGREITNKEIVMGKIAAPPAAAGFLAALAKFRG
ncbi:MAG TPA: lipid-binding SYLF domain-containing protein [Vicinamibacterales bacterium]|nr:lipid-binding SYLF domain-containing protein [Vicinamibacterales bacterium]